MSRRRRRAMAVVVTSAAVLAAWLLDVPARWSAGRSWDSGVEAALAGDFSAAGRAFEECLLSRPGRGDCRAGLRLAGKAAASPTRVMTSAAPMPALEALQAVTASELSDAAWRYYELGDARQASLAARRAVDRDPDSARARAMMSLLGARSSAPR